MYWFSLCDMKRGVSAKYSLRAIILCWVVRGNGNQRAVEQRVNLRETRHNGGAVLLASSVADV